MAFNREKPFATVGGSSDNEVLYIQDGWGYRADYTLIGRVDEFNNVLKAKAKPGSTPLAPNLPADPSVSIIDPLA